MTPLTTIEPTLPTGPSPTGTPAAVNDNAIGLVLPPIPANEPARPLHTKTESTLAPTSEFVRYFLLAYPSRYLFRGLFGLLTGEDKINELSPLSQRIRHNIHEFGRGFYDRIMPGVSHRDRFAVSYNAALGIGSTALTTSYGWMVYKDIKNIFSEAVAAEKGKRPEELTYKDFANSDNRILQQTMRNFKTRFAMRFLTDLPFFGAAWLRDTTAGDFMLGLKAVQLLADTWKRKTTMFEDFVTFINNKINPRNGIGQPIAVGEVFDLYQHYTEATRSEKMFQNVLERGTGEGARWARAQPLFLRMTQLMNLTYAYKHVSQLGPDGHAVQQADFTLPKFIYLLGHDLIDVDRPERTMMTVELANRYGIPAVKDMQTMLNQGASLDQVRQRYPYPTPPVSIPGLPDEKNGVIAKGSTMQLDAAPGLKIDAASVRDHEAPARNSLLPTLV